MIHSDEFCNRLFACGVWLGIITRFVDREALPSFEALVCNFFVGNRTMTTTTPISNHDKSTSSGDIPGDETLVRSFPSSYQIEIQSQPPTYVFLGEPFTIDFLVVEEDRCSDPEKTSVVSTGVALTPSLESNVKENDVASDSAASLCIPSFQIMVELLLQPHTHENAGISINSSSTDKAAVTEIVPNLNHSSITNHTTRHSSSSRQPLHSTLTLNVHQDPSPLPLGEYGTIQCSLTVGNSLENFHSEEYTTSSHHRNRTASPSTAISTVIWDASPVTCHIRITAICIENEEQLVPQPNKTSLRRSASTAVNIAKQTSATMLTTSITVVRHKILITSYSNDGNNNAHKSRNHDPSNAGKAWTSVWYKDEGGRDKSIELVVGIYDRHHVALFEAIPLLLTLCYASSNQPSMKQKSLYQQLPVPVTNQDILNVLSPKPNQLYVLDRATGTMKIRFRVEDVSKNHQGQDFCLLIAAAFNNDECQYLQNYRPAIIAPAVSLPINVRSKRNKRPRQFTASSTNSSIPASDVSSDNAYQHGTVLPSIGNALMSPTVSSTTAIENYPRFTAFQLQFALRSVVHWVQEVVTKTAYELQKHNVQNSNSTQYLSSMTQSMAAYHNQVQQHLNMLQYIVDYNANVSTLRPQNIDANKTQLPVVNSTRDCQHGTSTSDYFRYYEPGNSSYPPGYYSESIISDSGSYSFHHVHPYQYHNPVYYAVAHSMNDNHSMHCTAVVRHGDSSHRQHHPQKDSSEYEHLANESTTTTKGEKLSSAANKRQRHPTTQLKRPSESTSDTKLARNRDIYKNIDMKKTERDLTTAGFADTALEAYEVNREYDESRESEVEYIFAKQFKSLRSGELLGYPAYTIQKELIGFYQAAQPTQPLNASNVRASPQFSRSHVFVPIQEDDFGVPELEHAKVIFDKADRSAIQAMSQCGSIEAMLHSALVYEWSQGLGA